MSEKYFRINTGVTEDLPEEAVETEIAILLPRVNTVFPYMRWDNYVKMSADYNEQATREGFLLLLREMCDEMDEEGE